MGQWMVAWANGSQIDGDGIGAIVNDLRAARAPTIVADAVDLAAASRAIALARSLNAKLDHCQPTGLAVMQDQGYLGSTIGESHMRADTVLWVGPFADLTDSDEAVRRILRPDQPRTHLCLGRPLLANTNVQAETFEFAGLTDCEVVGVLNSLIAGKPNSATDADARQAQLLVDKLKSAKYGVVAVAPSLTDTLTLYALMALVSALSVETRWTIVGLNSLAGQSELQRMSVAETGLPPPLSFRFGRAMHDHWLYNCRRIIEGGEADVAVWLSSSEAAVPQWMTNAGKVIVLSAHRTPLAGIALQLEVGIAGVDHPALLEPSELGCFVALSPGANSRRPDLAHVLSAITDKLLGEDQETAA